ncbi:MAG: cyclodeaminase/cyclohydrolase family protein [Planctomycetota bacterium]
MLNDKSVVEFINTLASKEVAPGGGSLGFFLVALGGSLILKTIRISQKLFPDQNLFKKYESFLEDFSNEFLWYVEKDAKDYIEAVKYAKSDKELFSRKLFESVRFLIDTVKKGLGFLNYLTEFSAFVKDSIYSDLECGRVTIVAGLLCLVRTGYANLKYIKTSDKQLIESELDDLKIKIDQIKYTV